MHLYYLLYCICLQDIPSPVSTPGPGRIGFGSIVTPTPLSSSAPARYSHHSPLTPIKFSLQVQPSVPTSTGNYELLYTIYLNLHIILNINLVYCISLVYFLLLNKRYC